jgi:hypothetical protein
VAKERFEITAAKLFAHGIVFSVATTLLSTVIALGLFVWVFAGNSLGGTLGLLLVAVAIFVATALAYGFVNSLLTRLLWFDVERGFGVYLAQGFLLLIALTFVESIPMVLIMTAAGMTLGPGIAVLDVQILLTGAFAFVTGLVGRWAARHWRTGPRPQDRPAAPPWAMSTPRNPRGLHCPRCGGTHLQVAADGSAFCVVCQKGVYATGDTRSSGNL